MRDVVDDIERWRASGERVALATVVSVTGSAPRGIGAMLAVSEGGEISGSVSGGCVEPAVIEEELRTLRASPPKLLQFGITEEQNVERIGLSCGGEIRVFVERMDDAHEALAQAVRAGQPAALATVIASDSPQFLGRKLLVREDGQTLGSLGEPSLDALALADATVMLRQGASGTRQYPSESGQCEIFIDVHAPPPTLIIVGAGHVSIPLAKLAKVLGYHVVVVDAREAFATRERLPDADELLVEWPDEVLARLPLTRATAIAVLTHDDKFDVPALAVALRSNVSYVGAIGSRSTRERRDARLREAGVTDEQIARIHGPIGLDLGARVPEEIALAILAQIVAVRNGRVP
ncbi:MAG: Xanthine and CO dehydrogenases maturation factor, XdhC/CoxF family [Ktedonobacterales bacterium]|jgi:xanthine dehydrogenase accessory factor|nr:MAG: Xanthine and CO dehydrogenases maturation factor, XdhC/CoxF family [Ktedonobacterales bacterium]